MRSQSPALSDAQTAEVVRLIMFVRLDFASGVIALNTALSDLDYNGDTYYGIGDLAGIDTIEESDSIAPAGIKLSLSTVPQTYLSIALNEDYRGRDCKVYAAYVDEDHQLIDVPELEFQGFMDYMEINLQKTDGAIILHVENHLADWNRPKVRRYNAQDQKSEYPNDKGFDFVEEMVEKEIVWGRPS